MKPLSIIVRYFRLFRPSVTQASPCKGEAGPPQIGNGAAQADAWSQARSEVQKALAVRYRTSKDAGPKHDAISTGVMHPLSSEVVKVCLPDGQAKPFPMNCLGLMTTSGAKGSNVNFSQISALLGQQVLFQLLPSPRDFL